MTVCASDAGRTDYSSVPWLSVVVVLAYICCVTIIGLPIGFSYKG